MLICFLCMVVGIMFAWPSSTLLIFNSANTTLHRPMTEGETALLGSLSSVGGLVGTPLAGIFLDRLGRKPCAILSGSMGVIAWAVISCTSQVEIVLTALFISGLNCAAILINTTYVMEICQENIRGAMISCNMVFYSVGMLVSYILGGCLSYTMMVYVNLMMSIISVLSLFLLAESPTFLMGKGMEKEASKSIAFYRNVGVDSKEVLNELETIRRAFNTDPSETTPEEESLNPEAKKEKLTLLQFFRKSKSTQRGLAVTLMMMTASMFQGLPVLQVYAEPLFTEAIPDMSANLSSIIFAIVSITTGFVSAYLSDTAGRRPLMIFGSLAGGVCCLLLGTQIHISWGPSWVTAAAIYLFSIVYFVGPGTVPYVLAGEMFLPEIRSVVTMVVLEWAWLCNFLILFIFNPLVSIVGLGPVFYLFSLICFLTMIYSYCSLPETKGLTVDAIQPLLLKRKKHTGIV